VADRSGILWGPVQRLETLVSESSTFQTWVGAGDAATALKYITVFETDDEMDLTLKRQATVDLLDDFQASRMAAGAGGVAAFNWTKGARVTFMGEVPSLTRDHAIAFFNFVGAMMADLMGDGNTQRLVLVPYTDVFRRQWSDDGGKVGYQAAIERVERDGVA